MREDLAKLPHPPSWNLEDELLQPQESTRLIEAELSQPLCTAVQIALVNLLRTWNIFPAAVVGHSSGEIAAAYACNALSATEAITIAYYRGQSLKASTLSGGMAAIGLGQAEASIYMVKGVSIACENSPSSTTISGDSKQLQIVIEILKKDLPEVFVRRLKVDEAYHSDHMCEIGGMFQDRLEGRVKCQQETIPFYSSVSGKRMNKPDGLNSSYWQQNLESRVLFSSAIQSILDEEPMYRFFVEIGPHSALEGSLKQILKAHKSQDSYVPTLIRDQSGTKCLLTTVGKLHLNNIPIDFSVLNPDGVVLTDLPIYPWLHEAQYWYENRLSKEYRLRKFPRHELLGNRVLEGNDMEPSWRNILHLDEVPWIRDHKIYNDAVFPAAGYIAMAIEAIGQITGSQEGFSLRHIEVNRALMVEKSRVVELMTTLRPVRLTNSLNSSSWYEFTIFSHDGDKWEKNCFGEIKGSQEQTSSTSPLILTSRTVSTPRWYKTMQEVGLNYTGAFQGLTDISADVVEKAANASIVPYQGPYPIHPTTIDLCLQLLTVAVSHGIPRLFDRVLLPTSIEHLEIRSNASKLQLQAVAESSWGKTINGYAIARSEDGRPAVSIRGVTLSALEISKQQAGSETDLVAQLEWSPCIDLLNPADLIFPSARDRAGRLLCEKLSILCIIETTHRLRLLKTPLQYLEKYRSWLETQTLRAEDGKYNLVEEAQNMTRMTSAQRLSLISHTFMEAKSIDATAPAMAIFRIFESAKGVFEGDTQALEVLMPKNVLSNLYDWLVGDYKSFLQHLGHRNPNLRILEIGAGTGGTTVAVLESLMSTSGQPMYSKYTYTDISSGFFGAAKGRFSVAPNMEYAVLDISKDPVQQGFVAGSYDLILAANVVHATPKIHDTLMNVRSLLHPRGRLLLQELNPTLRWLNYIMGVLPDWWLGEDDGRYFEPYIPLERWDAELRNAGFQGVDAGIHDDEMPLQVNMSIVSTISPKILHTKKVALLYEERNTAVDQIYHVLLEKGYDVESSYLRQEPPDDKEVISLLDLAEPFLRDVTAAKLQLFQEYMGKLKHGLLWVTESVHIECTDPSYGMIFGAARTMRSELSLDIATLEIDSRDPETWTILLQVFEHFQSRDKKSDTDPDYEFALLKGVVYVGRYNWLPVNEGLSSSKGQQESEFKTLEIGTLGLLQTLQWEQARPDHLADDEVLVEIKAVGLNFRDVLIAMGQIRVDKDGKLGCEASGIVRQVGSNVTDLCLGDRVFAFPKGGCFSTFLKLSALHCAKIPSALSFEDAATMPCVYSTVIHGLIDVGRLEQGQTALIQSACGGVGIAAIQICRMIGVQIFATVGSEEKVKHLVDVYGIPRENIFNSRDTSFYYDLMRRTANKGADIVLNSLSGELLHLSWQCVAEYGTFIEIGKRDFLGRGKLSMENFGKNRAFFGVDIFQISQEKPRTLRRLLNKCAGFYDKGFIQPIHPITSFDATRVEDAFRHMQSGQHIGKIIATMPEHLNDLQTAGVSDLVLRSDSSYLLTGGLGGLGRAVSTWMVECGAKHLIYLSRSAGKSNDDESFLHELHSQGCSTKTFAGDVADSSLVEEIFKNAARPIAGVIQMSMVLKDRGFLQMTYDDWQATIAPKVQGTWNLHSAIQGKNLDFFVLFSSLSGIIGQIGQVNYAAANTFLDSFVQYRHSLGLPASVLDIGAMSDIGYVSNRPSILAQLRSAGMQVLREPDLLNALHLAILRSPSLPSAAHETNSTTDIGFQSISNQAQLAIGLKLHVRHNDPKNKALWRRDARMSRYAHTETSNPLLSSDTSNASNKELISFLSAVATDASILDDEEKSSELLGSQIGLQLHSFMLTTESEGEPDLGRSPSDMGVDSLVSIEIRNWWRQTFGVEISVLEIMNAKSLRDLGKMAVKGLKQRLERRNEPSK